MTRVPRNKGSYFARKGGTFQVKYPLGWSKAKGAYDEYREDVASEAEAIALIKAINDFVYHRGDLSDIPRWRKGESSQEKIAALTVAQFAEEFNELREKQKSVEPRTVRSDRESFSRIRPYIGDMPLAEVEPRDIDLAYARMRSDGDDNLSGHAYSGTSLQKTHAYLAMLFEKAIDYGYIEKNPLDKAERPKRDTAEKRTLTLEEAQSLFSCIASAPLAAKPVGVLLCLCCGLRLSEMLALTWDDYSDGAVRVNKSLNPEKQTYKSTKNGEERTVPCPPPLIAVLDQWMTVQKAWFEERGLGWSAESPIVQSKVGNHTLQRSFSKWFARERLRYPIPDDFTVHGLRHTYVTLLSRDCGIDPRTTRSLSGHKSSQAFAIYNHTNEEWQRKAASSLGAIIAPSDDSMRCQNCKYWTASPTSVEKGACWCNGDGDVFVSSASGRCQTGSFLPKAS